MTPRGAKLKREIEACVPMCTADVEETTTDTITGETRVIITLSSNSFVPFFEPRRILVVFNRYSNRDLTKRELYCLLTRAIYDINRQQLAWYTRP